MSPSKTKVEPGNNGEPLLVKAIKFTIVIAAIGVVLCFIFMTLEH